MSIKANELRIKNLVLRRGIEEDVYTLGTSTINGKPEHEFSPIPITPELLEKCGFSFDEAKSYFYLQIKGNGLIALHKDDFSIFIADSFDELGFAGSKKACIKSVHQLQNLYYCLTGSELECKL